MFVEARDAPASNEDSNLMNYYASTIICGKTALILSWLIQVLSALYCCVHAVLHQAWLCVSDRTVEQARSDDERRRYNGQAVLCVAADSSTAGSCQRGQDTMDVEYSTQQQHHHHNEAVTPTVASR
jgi:hypothetical protein